jgi:signal transduction histidine kinase
MFNVSLKYRIAAIIFVLEAVMITFVLGVTLTNYHHSNSEQSAVNEQVLLNLLSDLSRIALFTAEYDELQPYIEEVVQDPRVVRILLMNNNNRVVVSSDVHDVGERSPFLLDEENKFWRKNEISNASGKLGTLAIMFSHETLLEANRKALDRGIGIALSGMIIIAFIGIGIGYLLTRRLETLKVAAMKMAEGDLNATANIKGNDEVAIVGEAFNKMARNVKKVIEELRISESELRRTHDQLEYRIQERTKQLAIARDQALNASRTKSVFLANMSHELRTPLNAIIGYSEMLQEEAVDLGHDDYVPDLHKIRNAGNHLLELINEILDLSKIEAGKVDVCLDEVEVRIIVEDIVTTITPLVEQNQNEFSVSCPHEIGKMTTDVVKVRQILINLLGNASKFTENGEIELIVSRVVDNDKAWIEFVVRDSGIGIAEEQMGNLFIEFMQVDASATRKYGGTGLGLTISKRYCNMLGGDIVVASKVGEGSVFTVQLPVKSEKILADDELGNSLDPLGIRMESPQELDIYNNRRNYVSTILIIDDDVVVCEMLERFLKKQGFEVMVADNGEDGLILAREQRPDVITLDVLMPDVDGWSVLRELKTDSELATIPVIMLTMSDDRNMSYTLGATHFLSKPLDRHLLVNIIRECVRNIN